LPAIKMTKEMSMGTTSVVVVATLSSAQSLSEIGKTSTN